MVKKLLTILITLILLTGIFYARQITFNEAQIVAENWTQDLEEKFNDQVRIIDGKEIFRDNIIVAYVFDLYPKGFVIIAPQDYLPPIKMYSTESDFEGSGGPLNDIIFKSNLKIIQAVDKGDLSAEKNFSGRNKRVFESYLRGDIKYNAQSSLKADSLQADPVQEVGPLLSSTWGQGGPYNEYCPNNYSGCVSTSFSQILNFHEWPENGQGEESYYDPGSKQTLTVNFDKEYEWWNMLDEYGSGTDEENNAVATLMFDVGVALHSAYFDTDTSANVFLNFHNLVDHFKYSPDMTYTQWVHHQKLDAWFNVAKNQIDNGWPCEYGIGTKWGTGYPVLGHSVAIDGYRIDGISKMIHLNMGWSGSHNGYFAMNNIYVNDIYNFNEIEGQSITINIYPYPDYKKPVGLPPVSITAEAFLNKSVFLSEYIVRLTWPESPSQDKRIAKYIIYQKDGEAVSEVERVDPVDGRTYEFRTKDLSGVSYSVGVIDKNGEISDMPAFVTPVLK